MSSVIEPNGQPASLTIVLDDEIKENIYLTNGDDWEEEFKRFFVDWCNDDEDPIEESVVNELLEKSADYIIEWMLDCDQSIDIYVAPFNSIK